ncbi:MAG: ABC transporter ATP-binding protein, partial [Propionibacteriaceae bacterium]|nr:ABC transporter ATP-binding protein [Propionibacteriaceae bacterium]
TTHYMEEAEALCDRVAMMSRGRVATEGTPSELTHQLGPTATLEDVFRHFAGTGLDHEEGGMRNVRSTRRTAGRLG